MELLIEYIASQKTTKSEIGDKLKKGVNSINEWICLGVVVIDDDMYVPRFCLLSGKQVNRYNVESLMSIEFVTDYPIINLDNYIKSHYKNKVSLSRDVGRSKTTISGWLNVGAIVINHILYVPRLNLKTGRALKTSYKTTAVKPIIKPKAVKLVKKSLTARNIKFNKMMVKYWGRGCVA